MAIHITQRWARRGGAGRGGAGRGGAAERARLGEMIFRSPSVASADYINPSENSFANDLSFEAFVTMSNADDLSISSRSFYEVNSATDLISSIFSHFLTLLTYHHENNALSSSNYFTYVLVLFQTDIYTLLSLSLSLYIYIYKY